MNRNDRQSEEGVPASVQAVVRDAAGIIFDCDGTLADTDAVHFMAWNGALKPHGYSLAGLEIDEFNGFTSHNYIAAIGERFGWAVPVDAVVEAKEQLALAALRLSRPMKHVMEVFGLLSSETPVAVVSNGTRENVTSTLCALGVLERVAVVITSSDPIRPKPAPDMFVEAARRMGVAKERCVVFEDSPHSLAAAHREGMAAVDVRNATLLLWSPSRREGHAGPRLG